MIVPLVTGWTTPLYVSSVSICGENENLESYSAVRIVSNILGRKVLPSTEYTTSCDIDIAAVLRGDCNQTGCKFCTRRYWHMFWPLSSYWVMGIGGGAEPFGFGV